MVSLSLSTLSQVSLLCLGVTKRKSIDNHQIINAFNQSG